MSWFCANDLALEDAVRTVGEYFLTRMQESMATNKHPVCLALDEFACWKSNKSVHFYAYVTEAPKMTVTEAWADFGAMWDLMRRMGKRNKPNVYLDITDGQISIEYEIIELPKETLSR